jgi:hypothetical protein
MYVTLSIKEVRDVEWVSPILCIRIYA